MAILLVYLQWTNAYLLDEWTLFIVMWKSEGKKLHHVPLIGNLISRRIRFHSSIIFNWYTISMWHTVLLLLYFSTVTIRTPINHAEHSIISHLILCYQRIKILLILTKNAVYLRQCTEKTTFWAMLIFYQKKKIRVLGRMLLTSRCILLKLGQ